MTTPVAATCVGLEAVLVAAPGAETAFTDIYLAVRDWVWTEHRFQVSATVLRDVLRASGLSLSFSADGPAAVHDVALVAPEVVQ
ncbi:hypothetical protein G6045_10920 [Streptomyces sp. YC504]|uniref:Uncharacterized protein n=1 Tax=Streptomyces mesophilus TaxID=1775132 RepID=A0A6G4XF61_9ACTN|nr:hypothetical protein [Streptomyces mesophilus]NGO76175.1 hypothetical protein [Streptomyces mesophilus]